MPDFPRLSAAIQARAKAFGLLQKDLIGLVSPEVSRATMQNLWTGKAVHVPNVATQRRIEDALGWEWGSISAVLDGADPTLIRKPMETTVQHVDVTGESDGVRLHRSDLPMDAQLALERGQLVGVDVLRWQVEGEDFSLIIVARTGEYDTEEKRAVAMRQAEEWARIKRGLNQTAENGSASPPEDTSA